MPDNVLKTKNKYSIQFVGHSGNWLISTRASGSVVLFYHMMSREEYMVLKNTHFLLYLCNAPTLCSGLEKDPTLRKQWLQVCSSTSPHRFLSSRDAEPNTRSCIDLVQACLPLTREDVVLILISRENTRQFWHAVSGSSRLPQRRTDICTFLTHSMWSGLYLSSQTRAYITIYLVLHGWLCTQSCTVRCFGLKP